MSLLDEVRANAASVSADSVFVTIDRAALEAYAPRLPLVDPPELDAATHYLGEPRATLAYVVTLDAINFGSGYFPHLRKRAGLSGYFTVASSLKDQFETHGPWSASELQQLTASECRRIFGQTTADETVNELMALFAHALNQLGEFVATRFNGDFGGLVSSARGSAEALASILAEMPFYQDVGFYKRAQLTAADLSLAGVEQFDDLDQLTIFADNLVPHVLRVDGILRYDDSLLERINREELIPRGSREELEIRACALHAVELMRKYLDGVSSVRLDYVLWNRGQQPAYKALPRHRTRTVFY